MDVLVVSSERLHENTGMNFYIGSSCKPVKSIDNATLRHSYGCFWFDFWFEAKLLGISLFFFAFWKTRSSTELLLRILAAKDDWYVIKNLFGRTFILTMNHIFCTHKEISALQNSLSRYRDSISRKNTKRSKQGVEPKTLLLPVSRNAGSRSSLPYPSLQASFCSRHCQHFISLVQKEIYKSQIDR